MPYQFTPRALPDEAHATADLVGRSQKLVSDRLRALIERMEPGVHGFTPHVPTDGGASAIRRHALQINQSFDAVSAEHSTWVKESGIIWRPAGSIDCRIVFDARVIGGRHLWTNSGLGSDRPDWMSDTFMQAALDQGMTGLLIDHYDQTDGEGQYRPAPRALNRVYQLYSPTPMRPNNPAVPLTIKAELLDGDLNKIAFADPAAVTDIRGRAGLAHGIKIDPAHVPTRVRYYQNAKGLPTELFAYNKVPLTVTGRLREIIERFEPGTHQFLPIDFIDKQGALIEQRFIFVVGNQIDSVSREHSQILFDGLWYNPHGEYASIVYNARTIGDRHVWRDSRISGNPILYSAPLTEAIHAAGFASLRFAHWDMR